MELDRELGVGVRGKGGGGGGGGDWELRAGIGLRGNA